MKKVIVMIFAIGLLPAFAAAKDCDCVAGNVTCLNSCALSKANTTLKNIQAKQQNAAKSVKAQKDNLTKMSKHKKTQIQPTRRK